MEITDIRVYPVDEDRLKAYASIVFDDCFIVNDLKLIEGNRGLFVSMPSRRRKRGGYRDVAHPLDNDTRNMIEESVISAYRAEIDREAREQLPEQRALDTEAGRGVASEPAEAAERPSGSDPVIEPPPGPAPPERAPRPSIAATSSPATLEPEAENAVEPPGGGDSDRETGPPSESDEKKRSALEELEDDILSDSFWSVS